MKKYTLLFFLLPLFQSFSKDIQLNNPNEVINICSKSLYYEDKTNKLSFEQIEKINFQNFKSEQYDFHFSPSTFWIKFTIDSKLSNDIKYIIQVSNWYIDVADLYCRNANGEVKVLKEGDSEVFSKRTIKSKYPVFSLGIKAHSTQTYFLKIENSQYNNFKIELIENLHYLQYKEFGDSRELILGLILMRFAFHISLLFYMFYDKNFRAYSYWGILLCFVYYFSGGYGRFVFPNSPYLANLAFFIAFSFVPAVMSLFIYQIFDISNRLPQFRWIFIVFATVGALNLAINLFFHHAYLSWAYIAFMAFFVLFQLVFSTWVYFKVYKPSFWYISPLILYLPIFSIYYIRNAGILDFNTDFNFIQFTFFLDFLSIPFITGALLKISKLENLKLEDSYFKEKVETEKLQELNTLKTQFFTNISHEFRTPLTLILNPIDDLKKKYPQETLFEPMRRNAQRLLILINQLLDLSKLDSGQMTMAIQHSDLAKFIQVLISSFSSIAESRNIDFKIIQNRKEAIAYFDADKIEKIVLNLISNAFKFTKDYGKINILVAYSDDFSSVEIIIEDNGIGISSKKIAQIFDRFYQIDGSHQRIYEGSGIGLALVKEMVSLHKGTIRVESTEGIGTSFYVNLPINKTAWEQEKINEVSEENIKLDFAAIIFKPVKEDIADDSIIHDEDNILLVVEDNTELRQYIRSVFEPNYRIIEAIDGQDGIEKALEFIPDIVISDLMMPRLDGFGFCKLLKSNENTSHIPVVLLTAKANVESRIEGFELGADDYLTKPFNKDEILARVKNLVTQRALLRQKFEKQIVDLKPSEVKISSIEEKFITKIKEIVEKHFAESEFDVEQFAKEMNMTSVVLRRKLKAISGQTVTEFVRNYRLDIAADRLKNKAGTVSEIAYQVGFESLAYFSKVFHEKFEKTPSEWK